MTATDTTTDTTTAPVAPAAWQYPLINRRMIALVGSEITPFIWKDRLYRVENFKGSESYPGEDLTKRFHEDGCRIVDHATGEVVSIPWTNHYFTTATVHNGEVHLIGGDYGWDRPWWHVTRLEMIRSKDLVNWTEPVTVLEASGDEHLFNNAIVHNGREFVMLYETDEPRKRAPGGRKEREPFVFKFATSPDLVHWTKLPGIFYGHDKYVGGPAMYFVNGFYYVLYVNDIDGKFKRFDTRLTRSRDLVHWEEAPKDRPFLSPDFGHLTNPEHYPGVYELNASDAELIEWQGRVLVWWSGGDQLSCGDHKQAEFKGTLAELLEYFYR